jgi:hypothetical protein
MIEHAIGMAHALLSAVAVVFKQVGRLDVHLAFADQRLEVSKTRVIRRAKMFDWN